MPVAQQSLRVERVVTAGSDCRDTTVDLAGESNVWIIGDDQEVMIIDPSHEIDPVVAAVAGRNVTAVVCTHGHHDHVSVAPEVAETLYAPILMHPADDSLWRQSNGDSRYWQLHDGHRIALAGTEFRAIHTPGHSAGSTCLYFPEFGILFGGDALLIPDDESANPATYGTCIQKKVLTLPESTAIYSGHGQSTTVGGEIDRSMKWRACVG